MSTDISSRRIVIETTSHRVHQSWWARRAGSPYAGAALIALIALIALVGIAVHLLPDPRPGPAHALARILGPRASEVAAIVIFVMTYVAIALGRIPGLRLDRAGAALAGAACMIGSGALTLDEAYAAIDFDTITLLLGMMIVVAHLHLSGFFRLVSAWVALHARPPLILLSAVVGVSGFFSAFLVNDTVCLVLTPLVLDLCIRLKRNPVPYLLAVAMASNIGSVATITGNPQNIIIGSLAHIRYTAFAATLGPLAAVGLLLTIALLAWVFRDELRATEEVLQCESDLAPGSRAPKRSRALMIKSVLVTLAMVAAFFAGVRPAAAAIGAGALMLLTRRVKSEKVYAALDWPLLVMFSGLFIVVAGLEKIVLSPQVIDAVGMLHLERLSILSGVAAVLSNVVSNVPAVLVLKPFVSALHDPQRAWLALAMASTLAGNFTLVGSVANLIVARGAQLRGVNIGFWPYFKVGAPLTALTLLLGVWWL
jgi:Na+/H+ antiporter NhaD/arsenite permease-like protein